MSPVSFIVLDAAPAVGRSWRDRWDSLRLFTPAGFTHLPGLPFAAARTEPPGKDAVADYLAGYAEWIALPVQLGTQVQAVRRDGQRLLVLAGARRWRTRNVVLATGAHHVPVVPRFADRLGTGITQLHARDYRRPAQLPSGPVLVVGHVPNLGPWTYPLLQRLGRFGATMSQPGLRGGGRPGRRAAVGRRPHADLRGSGVVHRACPTSARALTASARLAEGSSTATSWPSACDAPRGLGSESCRWSVASAP